MEKKRDVIGAPVTIDSATVIPVMRYVCHCQGGENGVICYGAVVPVTVLVESNGRKRAFKTTGEEVPVKELLMCLEGGSAVPVEDPKREE